MGKKDEKVLQSEENLARLRFEARILIKRVLNEAEEELENTEKDFASRNELFDLSTGRAQLYGYLKRAVMVECASLQPGIEGGSDDGGQE